ncbi:MAG TPA: DNA polymerase III subunit gamma/tau [Candidatus Rubrimentiphilum sp.]|nr:DNA polymerase III subunit gamma/tau [Candidatus Rubrimentiphilum sp.]
MSLYRDYRPKSFAELVGQEAVVRTLTSAIASGKLAHAYLFSGPRGSGKTSAAKILARCIDCIHGPTATPDNTCENCRAILAGTALDVLEIDAASNRGIDEIRALRDAVKFAPSSMRMKVYIIDEAHMLTKEGANAFLKTLEEPPPHAVFILATTEPEKLPLTILSRCQRYAFRRIAIPVMIERMREIAAAEKMSIDDEALSAIAYRADGGLRDALTMLEQAAAFADGSITAATVELAFGASGRSYARTLLDRAIAKDASGILKTIDDASDAGTDMQVLIRGLIAEFRNLIVARIDPELLTRDLAPDDAQAATQRSRELTQAQIVRALRMLAEALSAVRSSGNPRLELETALLRFALAAEDPTLDAISARVSALEERPATREQKPAESKPEAKPAEPKAVQAKPAPASKPAASNGPVTIQKVRSAWQSIRTRIEGERQSLRTQLSRAQPDSIEGNALVIALPNAVLAETLKDNVKMIEDAIAEVLGTPLRARFKVEAGAGKNAPPVPQADDPDELLSYINERMT